MAFTLACAWDVIYPEVAKMEHPDARPGPPRNRQTVLFPRRDSVPVASELRIPVRPGGDGGGGGVGAGGQAAPDRGGGDGDRKDSGVSGAGAAFGQADHRVDGDEERSEERR